MNTHNKVHGQRYTPTFLTLLLTLSTLLVSACNCALWPYSDFYKTEDTSFQYNEARNTLDCNEPLKFIGHSKGGWLHLNNPDYEPMEVGGILKDDSLFYVLPDEVVTIQRGPSDGLYTETCTRLILKEIDPFKMGRLMDADEIIFGNLFCKIERKSEELQVFNGTSYFRTTMDNLYLKLCSAWSWLKRKVNSIYP